MKNKIGLILSHLHVRDHEKVKFDILSYVIDHFRTFKKEFFIVVSGHGSLVPQSIIDKADYLYWESPISHNEIGRGHPKFCLKAYEFLKNAGIEKTVKLRWCDLISNEELLYQLLDDELLTICEQTSVTNRMIGDLLMLGSTEEALSLWGKREWNYKKSGLYNLYDNLEALAGQNAPWWIGNKYYLVHPADIGWYTLEDNWDSEGKCLIEPLDFKYLWGMSKGYTYYRGV
mgnify:FL=1